MVFFKDIAGALGAILGYLGAEVATADTFERLLWPQRFYNNMTFITLMEFIFLLPSGGPLHRAALETLKRFQENGLYRGTTRGNMLGTAFYRDLDVVYHARTIAGQERLAKETRNGFWVEVSRRLIHGCSKKMDDEEKTKTQAEKEKRADIPLRHITLKKHDSTVATPSNTAEVYEDTLGSRHVVGVIASELSSLAAAVTAASYAHTVWLAVYFCMPLCFKLASLATSVHRKGLEEGEDDDSGTDAVFELDDLDHGLVLIQGAEHTVRQFFRHYGHPIRGTDRTANRAREWLSISLVYLIAAYFPTGLISLLWMNNEAQGVWLVYQLYTVFAMHIACLFGFIGCGRTEERVAQALSKKGNVVLKSSNGLSILAHAETTWYKNVKHGRIEVKRIIEAHKLSTGS